MSKITYQVEVHSNGSKYWYLNDKPHREDGPAVELANGSKYWYINGKVHREDGPAVELANGKKGWWINGVKLTKQKFEARQQSCNGKVVEIDGKKYKLTEI